jgi:hypothetical protein
MVQPLVIVNMFMITILTKVKPFPAGLSRLTIIRIMIINILFNIRDGSATRVGRIEAPDQAAREDVEAWLGSPGATSAGWWTCPVAQAVRQG